MRTIALVLSLAAAPAMALACDSPSDPNSATFVLRDGNTTRLIGSVEDLKRIKPKLPGNGPALFIRLDGQEYVIDDAATVDRARAIFPSTDPFEASREDEASAQPELNLEQLAREAIRAGRAHRLHP